MLGFVWMLTMAKYWKSDIKGRKKQAKKDERGR